MMGSKKILKLLKLDIKSFLYVIINLIILVLVSVFVLGPIFSWFFQRLSPWYEQKKAISEYIDVRDAYSAINGSDIGITPQNGLMQWFSTREKEITIYIPKLINYSPIFDDESQRNELKNAFTESLNLEMAQKASETVTILYDGDNVVRYSDGDKETYLDLDQSSKNEITNMIKEKLYTENNLKFKKWLSTNKFTFDPYKKNMVVIDTVFSVKKNLIFSEDYRLKAKLIKKDLKWTVYKNNWKVEKRD